MPRPTALAPLLVGLAIALAGAVAVPTRFLADKVEAGPQQGACDPQPVVPIAEDFFTYVTEESGIDDENQNPDIAATDHSRLGFVDLDGDGYDDIVTHNMTNPDTAPFEHLIYRNKGDGTFESWSDQSGLRTSQSAFLAFGDVDNDGDQDCFAGVDAEGQVDRGFSNQIFLNDGEGHFTLKENSGVEGPPTRQDVSGNAIFADFNGDTKLDLFVGNGATSARYTNQLPDRLYFGNGDGTFVEVTQNLQPIIW